MAEGVWESPARGPGVKRSTPMNYRDFYVVIDTKGQRWQYSEPADVWWAITESDEMAPYSARSYHHLLFEFGPLALSDRYSPRSRS